jgi:hypothetical protein
MGQVIYLSDRGFVPRPAPETEENTFSSVEALKLHGVFSVLLKIAESYTDVFSSYTGRTALEFLKTGKRMPSSASEEALRVHEEVSALWAAEQVRSTAGEIPG